MNNTTVSNVTAPKNRAIAVTNIINRAVDRDLFHTHKIAKPNQDYYIFDNKLSIAGWIVGKKAISAIEVCLGKNVVATAYLTVKRPGLNKKYHQLAQEHDTEFGFRTTINLPKIKAARKLVLKACFQDGLRQNIGAIDLEVIDLEHSDKPTHISPDFIIIGAMKSATSAIYDYLCRHSRVIDRLPKETHFLSKEYAYQQGWNWYLSQFAIKQNIVGDRHILVGEASPSYMYSLDAAARIKTAFLNLKIIISLRNPVDRAISHYYHQVNRVKDEPRNIQDAFSAAEITKSIAAIESFGYDWISLRRQDGWMTARYLYNGLYARHLKHWLKVFPPEQLLVLDYHQLETNPNLFLNRLFSFLDLQDEIPANVEKVYTNNYPDAPPEVRERLNNYFEIYNKELRAMPEIKLSWA